MTRPSTVPDADVSPKTHTLWSVSTSLVASPTAEELRAFYAAACEAGAPAVELGRNTPDETVSEAERLVDPGQLVVSSLHHPVPSPRDDAGARVEWMITDLDRGNWERAVRSLEATLRQAHRLRARAIVVHVGQVTSAMPANNALIRLLRARADAAVAAGGTEAQLDAEIVTVRQEMVALRAANAAPHLAAAVVALDRVVPLAQQLGVRIGLESHYYYAEVPATFEFAALLAPYPEDAIGYWHDVGHAMCQQVQGVARYADFLQASSRRIVGFHLHDIIGTRDHRAPGTGEMDYSTLVPLAPPDAVRTLELSRSCSWEDVASGVRVLRAAGLQ